MAQGPASFSKLWRLALLPIIFFGATGYTRLTKDNVDESVAYYLQTNRLPPGAMWVVMTETFLSDCKGMFRLKRNRSALYQEGLNDFRLMGPRIAPVKAHFRQALKKTPALCDLRRRLILDNPTKNYDLEVRR